MSAPPQAPWPELPTAAWRDTYATVHLWTQIVGKIRLVRSPWLNHSWHVALYVTPRGLTTSPIPEGAGTFQIDFDFVDHVLRVTTSDGRERQFTLSEQSVASFYANILATLAELGIQLAIDDMTASHRLWRYAAQAIVFAGMDILRVTIGWAWTYVVVAELVAARSGLGYISLKAMRGFQVDVIFMAIAMIGIMGLFTDTIFRMARRAVAPWAV